MNDFINNLKNVVTLDVILYICLLVAGILVITIVLRSMKLKKTRKYLEEYELRYAEVKGIPLSFKLNKATALSKVNSQVGSHIAEYQTKFDEVQEQLKEYSTLLAEIDDLVFSKKMKRANEKMDELEPIANRCLTMSKEVNDLFDEVLEQENMQRASINELKNEFRNAKKVLMENRGLYRQSLEFLDNSVTQIENMFSIFEEWMFASEFNKADDKQNEIKAVMQDLQVVLNVLPTYYEKACIVLPNKEEELAAQYAQAMQEGVYLDHLEVKKNIEVISDMISDVLMKLSEGHTNNVDATLQECDTRIAQLFQQIEKEKESFGTISTKVNTLFSRVKDLNVKVQSIKEVYARVHERFGFENMAVVVVRLEEQLDSLNELRFKLESILSENTVPYSTLLTSYEEVEREAMNLENEAKELSLRLENATSDEERAKKQLVKLQLIVNQMRIKISKHRLPSVDEKFEEDIRSANVFIVDIKEILSTSPLEVPMLNQKLQEAIDYIYTLYNSVNNLVGMAVMVENAILFGNKYRSEYPEVDSELTRAELCFSNGQYTKSLKIAISTIEKLHPGAYEKLISDEEVGANASA